MIEVVGYIALAVSLLSVNMNNMLRFRMFHLLASLIYLVYGCLIGAMPIIIGAALFSLIHCYRIIRLLKNEWH